MTFNPPYPYCQQAVHECSINFLPLRTPSHDPNYFNHPSSSLYTVSFKVFFTLLYIYVSILLIYFHSWWYYVKTLLPSSLSFFFRILFKFPWKFLSYRCRRTVNTLLWMSTVLWLQCVVHVDFPQISRQVDYPSKWSMTLLNVIKLLLN